MAEQIDYRSDFPSLRMALNQLAGSIAGDDSDTAGVATGLQLRVGVACLSQVQQAFIVKSRGGVGSDGIKWPALKRSTIAGRRTTRGERKALGIGGKRERGILTPAQNARWRQIYGTRLARLRMVMPEGAAKARAAQIAWAILKSEGAKTKLEVLGGRQVDMLRDTGELLRSLSPGVEDRPSSADGQVFRVERGLVIVGTNKKTWHHTGTRKMPARPLWPVDGVIPEPWMQSIMAVLTSGLLVAIRTVLRR